VYFMKAAVNVVLSFLNTGTLGGKC
jgi:hypothetical protein